MRAEVEESGDGIVARLVDRTFENPATSGGLLVMALTATAIVSNAMFLQGAQHPEPLFSTRDPIAPVTAPAAIPPPMPAMPAIQDRVIETLPMPHLAPRAAGNAPTVDEQSQATATVGQELPLPPAPVPLEVSLIASIQRELARVGLYTDAIDGVAGPRTEAAIRAFEAAAGIAVTGRATPEVLAALHQPPPRMTNTIATTGGAIDPEAAVLAQRERQRADLIAAEERRQADLRGLENTRIVQTALNRIGYGPLPMDGSANSETIEAIRRFELDNGMPLTGSASDALVARLISIGAVKPG